MGAEDRDFRLISLYFDGVLDSEELSELEQRLIEDTAFADLFARCSLTHRQVIELLTEDKLHLLLDQAVASSPSLPRGMLAELTSRPRRQSDSVRDSALSDRHAWGNSFVRLPAWTWLATAVLAAVGFYLWQRPAPTTEIDALFARRPEATAEEEWPVAATLTRMVDCRWADDAVPLSIGDQLKTGTRVTLAAGLAKLTFECGAEVVLQGPCDFLIESPMLGFLQTGTITAIVPRRAFTFAIRAPGVDFVDLGTDFGITVDGQGQSELHVFEGEVLYRQNVKERKSSDVVHVKQHNAVKFVSLSEEPSAIAVDKQLFSRHFDLRRGGSNDVSLPVQRDLAFWLSADQGVDVDPQGHVLSWHDRIYGDNKVAEDAFQTNPAERPRLVPAAMNGMPAVRFDGHNDHLYTTPIETTNNQTVWIVCQYSPDAFSGNRIYGGQILNYDGPPSRELSNTLAPGILQIGEPLLREEFKASFITAQVFAGFIGNTTVEAGRVDAAPVGANAPVIITYHYDFDNRKATLMLNGRVYGEANAFAPAGLTSRKVIGGHAWMELFFHGDLSELLIFNRALASDEVEAMTRHLADRYQIPIADLGDQTLDQR